MRKIANLEAGLNNQISQNKILKDLDTLRESIALQYKEFLALEQALIIATSTRLTRKQRFLLKWISKNYAERDVYTNLISRLSEDLKIPRSTIRWNLRGLREAGLIRAGDKENKGIPVRLTDVGKIMVEYFPEGSI